MIKKRIILPALLIVLTLFFLYPFFRPGFFETDDGGWAIVRLSSMHRELRQGQLPVRWSGDLNFGYGYPLFNFSYPGPYYLGEIFNLVGFNYTNSIKSLMVVATIVSVVAMYYFTRELWRSNTAGIIGALLYLCSPYRFVNLYVRGSVGEIVAFAIFPLVCLMGLKLIATGKRRFLLLGAALLGLLIITHNVLAFLFFPFLVYFLITEIFLRNIKLSRLIGEYISEIATKKKLYPLSDYTKLFLKHIHLVIVMVIMGLCFSAFFWLPALSEIEYVRMGETPLTNIDAEFSKTIGLFVTPLDNHPFLNNEYRVNFVRIIDYSLILVILACVVMFLRERKQYSLGLQRTILYTIPFLITLFLLHPISAFVWKNVPILDSVDFPWRIHGVQMFMRPIIVASLALLPNIRHAGVILSVITILLATPLVKVQKYINYPDEFYSTNQGTTTSANEYLNVWTTNEPTNQANHLLETVSPTINFTEVKILTNKGTDKTIQYSISDTAETKINIMYFPGWNLYVDGNKHTFEYTKHNGVISAQLPAGKHTLRMIFEKTPIRKVAETITVGSIALVVCLFSIQYLREKRRNHA